MVAHPAHQVHHGLRETGKALGTQPLVLRILHTINKATCKLGQPHRFGVCSVMSNPQNTLWRTNMGTTYPGLQALTNSLTFTVIRLHTPVLNHQENINAHTKHLLTTKYRSECICLNYRAFVCCSCYSGFDFVCSWFS